MQSSDGWSVIGDSKVELRYLIVSFSASPTSSPTQPTVSGPAAVPTSTEWALERPAEVVAVWAVNTIDVSAGVVVCQSKNRRWAWFRPDISRRSLD